MIYYLKVRSDNRVIGFSEKKHVDYPTEYDFNASNVSLEQFKISPIDYNYIDGKLIYNENYKTAKELQSLRAKRDYLFQKYLDRSVLFYNRLSEDQMSELDLWYVIWCDMPETIANGTWVEPTLPSWL